MKTQVKVENKRKKGDMKVNAARKGNTNQPKKRQIAAKQKAPVKPSAAPMQKRKSATASKKSSPVEAVVRKSQSRKSAAATASSQDEVSAPKLPKSKEIRKSHKSAVSHKSNRA